MKILVTGGSGFLGRQIIQHLEGNDLDTLGRSCSTINCDLSQSTPFLSEHYDMIIHSAGRAHVSSSDPRIAKDFFNVNVLGTKNLLDGVSFPPKYFIFISSVAVYGRLSGYSLCENTPLLANDPYGVSKIEAEKIIQSWCAANNVKLCIFRLPLIAGPNPPGNLGSMIKGIKKGYYFNIENGKARKSIVLAKDVVSLIPTAAKVGGLFNLTDGNHPSFVELSELIAKQLGKNKPANIPNWIATIMAKTGDILGSEAPINSDKLQKITSDLTFDDSKAREMLGWDPTPVLKGFKISE